MIKKFSIFNFQFLKSLPKFFLVLSLGFLAAGCGSEQANQSNQGESGQPTEKIYVAVEGEGKIAVIDAGSNQVIKNISLSFPHQGSMHSFAPHNVQVAPDGKSVWVTANVGGHEEHSSSFIKNALAHGEDTNTTGMGMMEFSDQVIVIDPFTDEIIKRVSIDKEQHLAHVVLAPDSSYAYVTAQTAGKIYKINARTFSVENVITAPKDSEPHGLRISPKGDFAYIAMLKSKALGILNLNTDQLTDFPLKGAAVQTGITPNGKYVLVSQYDTKALAVYDTTKKFNIQYVPLPEISKGPVQMYPTPDSKFAYVADQGYYFKQPTSELVYKIDLETMKVVKEIKAGTAPHGIVVSKDGKKVYVTNLLSKDVSIIDTAIDQEIGFIKVGSEPNGISIWHKTLGGTP